jgi:hypothetical protein
MTGGSNELLPAEEKKESRSLLVVQQVVQKTDGSWPMLNRTNYVDWALLMQVMLEVRQLWVTVNNGMLECEMDRTARECLLRSVPPKMLSTLAIKATANEAW